MSLSNIARDCVTGEGRLERRLRFVTDMSSYWSSNKVECRRHETLLRGQ